MFKEPPLLNEHHHLTNTCKLDSETIKIFGVGYCPEKCDDTLAGRVVIPLHSAKRANTEEYKLVGYAGWFPGRPSQKKPQYLFRMRSGIAPSDVVFNLNRARGETYPYQAIVFNDPLSVIKARAKHNYRNVVALMCGSMSLAQEVALVCWARSNNGILSLVLEGDPKINKQIALRLCKSVHVKMRTVPSGMKPENLPASRLDELYA